MDRHRYTGCWLLSFDPTGGEKIALEKHGQTTAAPGGRLVCHLCHEPISELRCKIEKFGAHQHRRTNPAGFAFQFGCFSVADGCVGVAEVSRECSWFPDYSWQIVVCRGCGEHVGWSYHGRDRFYGLILDRLLVSGEQGRIH